VPALILRRGWELVPLKYNPRAYVRRERAGHGALTSVTAHHQWNFQEPSALLRRNIRNISHVKGIGHMHSYIRFKRMKHGLILSLLAMLVAVALPGLAEARGGHDEAASDMEEGTPAAEQRAASEEPAPGSAPSPQAQITGLMPQAMRAAAGITAGGAARWTPAGDTGLGPTWVVRAAPESMRNNPISSTSKVIPPHG
jgi:hypothetical protein